MFTRSIEAGDRNTSALRGDLTISARITRGCESVSRRVRKITRCSGGGCGVLLLLLLLLLLLPPPAAAVMYPSNASSGWVCSRSHTLAAWRPACCCGFEEVESMSERTFAGIWGHYCTLKCKPEG